MLALTATVTGLTLNRAQMVTLELCSFNQLQLSTFGNEETSHFFPPFLDFGFLGLSIPCLSVSHIDRPVFFFFFFSFFPPSFLPLFQFL